MSALYHIGFGWHHSDSCRSHPRDCGDYFEKEIIRCIDILLCFNYQEILSWYYKDIDFEPNGEEYIVINKGDKDNKPNKEDDPNSNGVNNDYSDSKADEVDPNHNNERGPLLVSLLEVVKTLTSWR